MSTVVQEAPDQVFQVTSYVNMRKDWIIKELRGTKNYIS